VQVFQWIDVEGTIQYVDQRKTHDIVSVIPDWANNAVAAWTVKATPPPPTPPTAESNKLQAQGLLSESDWSVLPDVTDVNLPVHLVNSAAFVAYRDEIRFIFLNPTDGELIWPVEPTPNWTS
jgi:hypothetical protein